MTTYNFIIIDINKSISSFLNLLDENEFLGVMMMTYGIFWMKIQKF